MKKALIVFRRLIHPPKWFMLIASPIVFAALFFIFITGRSHSVFAYPTYGMSAYCTVILLSHLPRLIKSTSFSLMQCVKGTALGRKYINDLAFRCCISLLLGIVTNFLYVAFRLAVGIRYASVWFISMAFYYLVLGIMRLLLIISYKHRENVNEVICYHRTALLLFLLNLPMGGMILLMVLTDSGYSYPGYVIYLSAIYTFYTTILSVINLQKYRALSSPVISAAKALNFIAALMSVLGLQTAMIAHFSSNNDSFRKLMNTITGGGVWLSVIFTAVYMLHRSKRMRHEVRPVDKIRK